MTENEFEFYWHKIILKMLVPFTKKQIWNNYLNIFFVPLSTYTKNNILTNK